MHQVPHTRKVEFSLEPSGRTVRLGSRNLAISFAALFLGGLTLVSQVAVAQTTGLQPGTLVVGQRVIGDVPTGHADSYLIALERGQYIHAVVGQLSITAFVRLFDPDGRVLLQFRVPGGTHRGEPICWIAASAGKYRLEVSMPGPSANPGHYSIELAEVRASHPDDQQIVIAQQLIVKGRDNASARNYQDAITALNQALPIFRKMKDSEREGTTLEGLGFSWHGLGQYVTAITNYEQALTIRRETGDRPGEAFTLSNLGWAFHESKQFDKAATSHEQAVEIYRELKDRQREANGLHGAGFAYDSIDGQQIKALQYYEQALVIEREIKSRSSEALTLNNIGWSHHRRGKYEKAMGYYTQALAISESVLTLINAGSASAALSRFENSKEYYERALAIQQDRKSSQQEGGILHGLGAACQALGQYEKSIDYYERALVIQQRSSATGAQGSTAHDLSFLYSVLGQPEKSMDHAQTALRIARSLNDRRSEGRALIRVGEAYGLKGNRAKQIESYEQAIAIARELKNRGLEALVLQHLGIVYSELGEDDKALYCLGDSLTAGAGNLQNKGFVLGYSGIVYRHMGQYEKAIRLHQETLEITRGIGARHYTGLVLRELMYDWKAAGRPGLAIFYGKQSVNTIQSIRTGMRSLDTSLQDSFLRGNEERYHVLADLLIEQGRLTEAEQVLNLLKEQEYFDFLRREPAEITGMKGRADLTAVEAEWETRYREIGDRLVAIGTQRGELLAKPALTPDESKRLTTIEQDLAAGSMAFERFLGDLASNFNAKPATSSKIEQLREAQGIMEDLRELPSGTVAIYTLIGEDKFRAILVTPNVQKAYEFPIKAGDLNRKILEFRQVVQNPNLDARPLARDLYKILLGNMADDLRQAKAQTLMWSLDGSLRYLPIAALFDGEKYLIEKYRVTVFTPASNARLKDRPDVQWKAAGFGVTKAFEGASALPSVGEELRGIIAQSPSVSGVLEGEIKLDAEFTGQAMRTTLLKHYAVVHIASHFQFQPGNETQSFLLLGDGSHLSLAELKSMPNLFGGVQLLTLSACNTGVGDTTGGGKEVEGFGVLAQRKGAKAVIASLWPVADSSTSTLMQKFYRIRATSAGMTKLEALRQAQLSLLRGTVNALSELVTGRALVYEAAGAKEAPTFSRDPKAPYAHPYYWAPFFLMGNWL